jgi:hypothetical protein
VEGDELDTRHPCLHAYFNGDLLWLILVTASVKTALWRANGSAAPRGGAFSANNEHYLLWQKRRRVGRRYQQGLPPYFVPLLLCRTSA